jgi:hypothetical protein
MADHRVLVFAPTAEVKDYALDEWVKAYRAFDYPDLGVFMAENTPGTLRYAHRVRSYGIPCEHFEPIQSDGNVDIWERMEQAWRLGVEYAHEHGYDVICSIESDVICPPETIRLLVELLEGSHANGERQDAAAFGVPARSTAGPKAMNPCYALGCTVTWAERLWEDRLEWDNHFEFVMWRMRAGAKFSRVPAPFEILHLEE